MSRSRHSGCPVGRRNCWACTHPALKYREQRIAVRYPPVLDYSSLLCGEFDNGCVCEGTYDDEHCACGRYLTVCEFCGWETCVFCSICPHQSKPLPTLTFRISDAHSRS